MLFSLVKSVLLFLFNLVYKLLITAKSVLSLAGFTVLYVVRTNLATPDKPQSGLWEVY